MIKRLISKLLNKRDIENVFREIDYSPYSKSMEKHKKKDGNESFELPFVQERYDAIVNALKYTTHSKRRQELLKKKRMYDEILAIGKVKRK